MAKRHHYVYILQCRDDTLYTGYTTDLIRRLGQHNRGKGARYTKGKYPCGWSIGNRFPRRNWRWPGNTPLNAYLGRKS